VILGHDAIAPAVAYDVSVSGTVCWTVGFAIGAGFGTKAGDNSAARIKAFFTRNPVLYALALGLLAPDSLAPQAWADVARTAFSLFLPIGFFVLGVFLMGVREDVTLDFPPRLTRPIALIIALRLVLAPALLLAGSRLIDMPDAYLLQAAMPSGILSVIIAHVYGLNLRLAASAVAWTTTIVVIAALAGAAIA
jgi:predicted permease